MCPHIPLSHGTDVTAGWKTNFLGDCSGSSQKGEGYLLGNGSKGREHEGVSGDLSRFCKPLHLTYGSILLSGAVLLSALAGELTLREGTS